MIILNKTSLRNVNISSNIVIAGPVDISSTILDKFNKFELPNDQSLSGLYQLTPEEFDKELRESMGIMDEPEKELVRGTRMVDIIEINAYETLLAVTFTESAYLANKKQDLEDPTSNTFHFDDVQFVTYSKIPTRVADFCVKAMLVGAELAEVEVKTI